jgi:hypothetical protein
MADQTKRSGNMVLSTIVKLKTLGLAKQIVTGAFINGALIGAATAAIAVAAAGQACRGKSDQARAPLASGSTGD